MHQAENRQQLGLVEQALAETISIARESRPGGLQGDADKGQESNIRLSTWPGALTSAGTARPKSERIVSSGKQSLSPP